MAPMLKSTSRPIAEAYRLALLDLDGVVYRGKNPVEHAADAIRSAEAAGMSIEYTTNNSSRLQRVVADQLRGFDLDVEPHQVITSSVVAARMVARHVPQGAKVLVLGAGHLREEVAGQGLHVVDHAADDPAAVIQGWYPDMSWNEMAEVAYAVERGASYFVTNRDLTIPRELGIAPGCGEQPVDKDRCLAIGDRLDTDIEAGNRGGYDSLAVLTGVTNPRELMLAPAHLRPTFIAEDLRGLLEAQPAVDQAADGAWTCGEAVASLDADTLTVSGGRRLDALRAACAAAWRFADNGGDAGRLRLPIIQF